MGSGLLVNMDKTNKDLIYNNVKQRKAASPHIKEGGTGKCYDETVIKIVAN